jgi:hypothetical protein
MSDCFQLIDLVSQAGAVRKLPEGRTDSETLHWLSEHGRIEVLPSEHPEQKQSYRFTSSLGREAIFFFDAGGLVFVGDHMAFAVDEE